MVWNADILTIKPYRQTIWWTRFLGHLIDTGSFVAHAWVGGAYDFEFGSAYISWCETASISSIELFSALASNGPYWTQDSASTAGD